MKRSDLKKLIREVAEEVMSEAVNIDQAIQKLKAFEQTLGGKHASIVLRREGNSTQWKIIADLAGHPDKFVELAVANNQDEAHKIAEEIIEKSAGRPYPKPQQTYTPPAGETLAQVYTVYDGNHQVGKANNVRRLYDLMSQADYPTMEPQMPAGDKNKYLAYADKQPKRTTPKWTGD